MTMHILFTGASSFTGMWFIKELALAGHKITAIFPREKNAYSGLRKERVEKVMQWCQPIFSCSFGSKSFLQAIMDDRWDLLCHHAADVKNYKSFEFDYSKALANNTHNIQKILTLLKKQGLKKVLLSGSVFEQGEGVGSDHLRAVSPYGLSKGLTADVFQFYCQILELRLGKFVIPNPFGPYEEPRFTTFLIKSWFQREVPSITAPEYFRDNVPVSLLARAYLEFANTLPVEPGFQKSNPSYYAKKQGDFACLFAKEMEKRLAIPCRMALQEQTEFVEPRLRINSDPLDAKKLGWNEDRAWEDLALFYRQKYGGESFG